MKHDIIGIEALAQASEDEFIRLWLRALDEAEAIGRTVLKDREAARHRIC